MIQLKKIAALFLFGLLTAGTTVFAQTAPAPQTQQEPVDVSDEQLTKFADAFMSIQGLSQQAQLQMADVVQKEGMAVERFSEIYQSNLDPQIEVKTSEEEQVQYEKIVAKIEKLQVAIQGDMEKAIAAQGLSVEEYETILAGLQQDAKLQERLKAKLQ